MTGSAADVRILFIGNSYTSRNDLPGRVAALAAAAEQPRRVDTRMIVAGGASLKRHWNAGIATQAIRMEHWDYVVLQEQSTLPVKNAGRYHGNVRLFAPEIAARRARPVLYLNWARRSAPQTQEILSRAVRQIAAEIDAIVAPVGPAWESAQKEIPRLQLYENDGSHPTATGSYLAACVFHVALFGERAFGDQVAAAMRVDLATARRLQAIAWNSRSTAAP
jgi:hypothetical protein